MSKEADEAFDAFKLTRGWVSLTDRVVWQHAWAEKQRRDLAAVETVRADHAHDDDYYYRKGWQAACNAIAVRIKEGHELLRNYSI